MRIFKIIFLTLITSLVYSQTTDWVKSFGGPESDKGISIGCDSLGLYILVDIIILKQTLIKLL